MIDPIEFLEQVADCEANIENLTDELIKLWAMATKITSTLKEDAIFASGNHDKINDAVAEIMKQEEKIEVAIKEYNKKTDLIYSKIQRLKNPVHIKVLYKKYFKGLSWRNIGNEMHFSERHAQRLHDEAILEFEKVLRKK